MGCTSSSVVPQPSQDKNKIRPIVGATTTIADNTTADDKETTKAHDEIETAPDLEIVPAPEPMREGTLDVLIGNNKTSTETTAETTATTVVPVREGTLDVLLQNRNNDTGTTLSLPLETLEDLIVDETVDVQETLNKVQQLINTYANDVTTLFDACRNGKEVISKEQMAAWGSSLDADIDEDTAINQYNEVCGYSLEEGGEIQPKPMAIDLFACCLVRFANLYTIQNKGNPMDSDIPQQLSIFWKECQGLAKLL